jgi:hypothetical protein
MKLAQEKPGRNWPAMAALAFVFAVLSGAVFAGWLNHSNKILWTMLQSSVAWCF